MLCDFAAARPGLAAEVEAIRLGGSLLDTVLTIYGPGGEELATVDDTPLFHQDPTASIVAPTDGDYVIQVRESNYEGDENSRYALHLGTFPRPLFVYPAGGPAGKEVTVECGGDAKGTWQQVVSLPSQVGDYAFYAGDGEQPSPTPNPLRVSPFENMLEVEPNDQPADVTTKVALPRAFNGILQQPGDVDFFCCELTAGQLMQFEIFAARIGSPIDTVFSILDEDGRVLAANDDDETHDSRLVFAAPRTAAYLLRIADKRGVGAAGCVYRIEAAPPAARLSAFLPRPNRLSQERQTISVPRGNRVAAMFGVQRTNAEGEVALDFSGLPEGVSVFPALISADRFFCPVVMQAQPSAQLAGTLARVAASSQPGNQPLRGPFVQVVDLIAGSADTLFQSIAVDRLAVGVTEEIPYEIELEAPRAGLAQDGTLVLTIRATRHGDFDGPLDVTLPYLPPWLDGPAKVTIPAGETTAEYAVRAHTHAEKRMWPIVAEAKPAVTESPRASDGGMLGGGQVTRRSRRSRAADAPDMAVSSQLVSLQVVASPVSGQFVDVTTEPGKMVKIVCQLQCSGPLPDQLTATLEGLPNRVHASPVTITGNASQVAFTLELESTAPVGSFTSLACRLSGQIQGQRVSYVVGRGGILKIEPPGKLTTDERGRTLSPLEALRRAQRPRTAQE